MCGRYAQYRSAEAVRAFFGTMGPLPNLAPSWNVAPTQSAPVVRRHPETGQRELDTLRWGLVPPWAKSLKAVPQPINARAETVGTSPMFKDAFAKRRCIVPADAFYEWQATATGKQPFAVARTNGDNLAFAGIWEAWRGEGGEVLRTYAIITTEANATMRPLHDRMPVILAPDDWSDWLSADQPANLLRPAPEDLLQVWQVSRAVNNVRNNGPELLVETAGELAGSDAQPGSNPE